MGGRDVGFYLASPQPNLASSFESSTEALRGLSETQSLAFDIVGRDEVITFFALRRGVSFGSLEGGGAVETEVPWDRLGGDHRGFWKGVEHGLRAFEPARNKEDIAIRVGHHLALSDAEEQIPTSNLAEIALGEEELIEGAGGVALDEELADLRAASVVENQDLIRLVDGSSQAG